MRKNIPENVLSNCFFQIAYVGVQHLALSAKMHRCFRAHWLEILIRDVHHCVGFCKQPSLSLSLCLCMCHLRFPDELYFLNRNKTQFVYSLKLVKLSLHCKSPAKALAALFGLLM